MLVIVGVIGVLIAWASRWRITPGLAIGWGLSWLAVGRLQAEPQSDAIGITAIIVAVVVIVVPVIGTVTHRAIAMRNAEE